MVPRIKTLLLFFLFFLLLLLLLIWFIYPFVALLEVTHWVRQNTPVYLSALLQGKVYLVGGFWVSYIVVPVTPCIIVIFRIASLVTDANLQLLQGMNQSINQSHYLQCICQTSRTQQDSCAAVRDINWICMIFVKFSPESERDLSFTQIHGKRIHFANNMVYCFLQNVVFLGGSQLDGDNEIKSRMSWGPSVLPDTDGFVYHTMWKMPIIIIIIILWQVPISCWQALLISLYSFAVGIYPRQQPPWRRENGTEKKYVTLKTVQVAVDLCLYYCYCTVVTMYLWY